MSECTKEQLICEKHHFKQVIGAEIICSECGVHIIDLIDGLYKEKSDLRAKLEAVEFKLELANEKLNRREKRLEIGPCGDDKIDELESSIGFIRHNLEVVEKERDEARRQASTLNSKLDNYDDMRNSVQKLSSQLEVMRGALEFYANEENYEDELISMDSEGWSQYRKNSVVQDNGNMASKALSTTPAGASNKINALVDAVTHFIAANNVSKTSKGMISYSPRMDGISEVYNALEAWKEGKPC